MWLLIIKIVPLVSWRTRIKVWVLYEYFLAVDNFSVIRLWIIMGNIQTVVIQAVLYLTLVSARYGIQITGCLKDAWETRLIKCVEISATGRFFMWGLIVDLAFVIVHNRVHAIIILVHIVLLKSHLPFMRIN